VLSRITATLIEILKKGNIVKNGKENAIGKGFKKHKNIDPNYDELHLKHDLMNVTIF